MRMPEALRVLGEALSELLYSVCDDHKLPHTHFNHVQVHGTFEVLNVSTGPNSDDGSVLHLGSSRGKGYQAARSPVVTYMIGECSMLFKFHPYVEDVRYATIPFAHGWLIVLMPADDTLCNHSLMMPHDVLKPHRYRTAFVSQDIYGSTGMVRR